MKNAKDQKTEPNKIITVNGHMLNRGLRNINVIRYKEKKIHRLSSIDGMLH